MSLYWITDTHFNFLPDTYISSFAKMLLHDKPDISGLVITGDISDGKKLDIHLPQLAETLRFPIYFTLGNHDYYSSSFDYIDKLTENITNRYDNLHWLNKGNCYRDNISIVGVTGWYDSRIGNIHTRIMLNDFGEIEDLWIGKTYKDLLFELIRKRADKEANQLDILLMQEVLDKDSDHVLVCTHVSPYPESSWHEGSLSNNQWLPWFCSIATGNILDKYMEMFPEKQYTVLSGHGHSRGIYKRSDNLIVYSGAAEYFNPFLAGQIKIDNSKIDIDLY